MIGQLLDGRYQIVRALGSGGFGQTFVAQDTRRPGSPICIVKHLKPASHDPTSLKIAKRLFQSEAEILEQLGSHPQIPRLLAYFEEGQEFYLVQEFIEGHPLTQEMRLGQRWAESQVIELLQDVLGILSFLHSKGAIHRDIKPDNIIRRHYDRKLVLVDFGAVKQVRTPLAMLQGETTATIAVGTPGYMPSEQGQGKPRPCSDIYALGVVAIQAVTGLRPYQIKDDPETGELIWQQYARISPELTAVLSKMVKCYFKERYASVAEVLQALEPLGYSPANSIKSFGYTPYRSTDTGADIPTRLATASAYSSTGLPPSNGHQPSGQTSGSSSNPSEQPNSSGPVSPVEQISTVRQIITHNQSVKPTYFEPTRRSYLRFVRTGLSKVLPVMGWGMIALTISAGVLFWTKRITPSGSSALVTNPPSTAKQSPAAKPSPATEPAPSDDRSFRTANQPLPKVGPLIDPLPSSPTNPSSDATRSARSTSPQPNQLPGSGSALDPNAASTSALDQGSNILAHAQEAAEGGRLLDAITTAQTISSESAAYPAAKRSIDKWQDKLSTTACQSTYNPPGPAGDSSESEERSGKITFTNGTNKQVNVTLYSPDTPDRPFQSWSVGPGENLMLGTQAYGVNWGIQVDCSAIRNVGDVSEWSLVDGSHLFQTSADRIL